MRVIATAAGNTVPPWKRTLRPFPFCASLAAFFVELGLDTTAPALGATAPSACDARRPPRRAATARTLHPPRQVTPHARPTACLLWPSRPPVRDRRSGSAAPPRTRRRRRVPPPNLRRRRSGAAGSHC